MNKDKQILQELAKKYAEIAALPVQEETKKAWYALNRLKPVRPMFLIDELPWNEMNVNDELTIQCEEPFFQYVETKLRQQIYRWNHYRDDFVHEPVIYIPKKIHGVDYMGGEYDGYGMDFGIGIDESTLEYENGNAVVSHSYRDQLMTEDDLDKVKAPDIYLEKEVTDRREQMAHEALDGILEVIMNGHTPHFDIWDMLPQWREFNNIIMDLIERPDFIHKTVNHISNCYHKGLDRLEEQGLLSHPQQLVHRYGAWTDLLPSEGYDENHPRAKDLWTFGMAQILYTVSPEMHRELEFEYAKKWYSRFGLGYYGCCEPLEERLEYLKEIPNVRKVSVSAWVKDYDKMAEGLEGKYVYSSKPSPAMLVGPGWNTDAVEKDLRRLLDSANRYNCPCEFTLKDISTVDHHPERIWKWADIMRKIVHESSDI